jgi:site-specific recombinase XerD
MRKREREEIMQIGTATETFITHCRSTRNLAPNTLRAYSSDLRDFARYLGETTTITTWKREDVFAYVRHLFEARGLSPATVKRRTACLRVFARWLAQEGQIPESPLTDVRLGIKIPRTLPRVLNHDEMNKLLQPPNLDAISPTLRKDFDTATIAVAIQLLYATGIRVGELVKIAIDDVDFAENTIRINGKGAKQRRVPIPNQFVSETLRRYLRLRRGGTPQNGTVFTTKAGTPLSTQHIRKLLKAHAIRTDVIGRVTPHMIRHTTATHLLENGVNLRYVQHLLGHESITTTQRYSHVNDSSLMRAIRRAHPLSQHGTLAHQTTGNDVSA